MSASAFQRRDRRAPTKASRLGRLLSASAAAGLFAYCALSVLLGPAGMTAYGALEKRKASMEANLTELASINARLSAELESLVSDPERAAAEARSLGYLRKGETAILTGEGSGWKARVDVGEVLPYVDPPALGDDVVKAISLGVGMALFAALLIPGSRSRQPRRGYRDRLVQSASLE